MSPVSMKIRPAQLILNFFYTCHPLRDSVFADIQTLFYLSWWWYRSLTACAGVRNLDGWLESTICSAHIDNLTLILANICSLLASVSPVYTTEITYGKKRWISRMAVHRTRSPPPPALLSISLILSIYINDLCMLPLASFTSMDEKIRVRQGLRFRYIVCWTVSDHDAQSNLPSNYS